MSSLAHRGFTHLGMDVSKNSISVAVLEPDNDHAVIDRIFHDEPSVRRLINAFPDPAKLWPATRRDPRAMTCTGCSPPWACAAR